MDYPTLPHTTYRLPMGTLWRVLVVTVYWGNLGLFAVLMGGSQDRLMSALRGWLLNPEGWGVHPAFEPLKWMA